MEGRYLNMLNKHWIIKIELKLHQGLNELRHKMKTECVTAIKLVYLSFYSPKTCKTYLHKATLQYDRTQ